MDPKYAVMETVAGRRPCDSVAAVSLPRVSHKARPP
jgi:hypothetical protein